MPKLWTATIDTHRRQVREAILVAAAAIVVRDGLRAVTMSQIASDAGIGRATLYKYFSGVSEILDAWHQREVDAHLDHLAQVRDRTEGASARLAAVLEAYVEIRRARHRHEDQPDTAEVAAVLHQHPRLASSDQALHGLLRDLIRDGVAVGSIRADLAPDQLASYCRRAADAAADWPPGAPSRHLVELILAGLGPME